LAEIGFYHLLSMPLERALPKLLERACAQGHRVVVRAASPERVEHLNAALWTYEEAAFLAHGSARDGNPAMQPIWLTHHAENPNGASMIVLVDGLEAEDFQAFTRCADVFDGNDADAVYRAATAAYAKARAGGGPSLIECMTYRHSGHSRADPAKYRPEGELDKWKERDPIKIYRERLQQFGIGEEVIAAIEADVKRRVDEATEKCKAAPPPPLELLTTDVYADGGFAWRN